MARSIQENNLNSIIEIVRRSPEGARRSEIAKALKDVPQRTLQYWLKTLVDDRRLTQENKGPSARYRLPYAIENSDDTAAPVHGEEKPDEVVIRYLCKEQGDPRLSTAATRSEKSRRLPARIS